MIIIEGPDNAGKSTLINFLLENLGDRVVQATANKGPRDNLTDTVKDRVMYALMDAVASRGKPIVYDRLFFSELVYSEALGRECKFNWEEQRHTTRVLTAISPPIVFCLPPRNTVVDGITANHQMEGVRAHIGEIYDKYAALSNLARPGITRYDFTRGPAAKDRVLRVVRTYLERRDRRTW